MDISIICPTYNEINYIDQVVADLCRKDNLNKEVLVIDQNGDQLGVKSSREALDIAYDANLDLVCVAPNAKPPVCRIMDFGKYRFEQQEK